MVGYIHIHRKMTQWEWYTDANTFRVFIHLLINASYEDNPWQGFLIKRGQVVTGRKKLARELNLSERQIRTSLNRLKTTNEIAIETTSKFSIITICKYADYQAKEVSKRPTKRPTKEPTNDQQTTTSKEVKEDNNTKGIKKATKKQFVPPTFEEVKEYFSEKGRSDLAKTFYDYYEAGEWHDKEGKPVLRWKQRFVTWNNRNPKPSQTAQTPKFLN
ncbi:MAG TPA: hypothetical protein DDW62_08785 [Marinilabiliaceae bacterium]|nr:hypothetical protein [Marinilabiliaceae bacterium]